MEKNIVKVKDLFKNITTVDKKKFNDALSYYEEVKKGNGTLTIQFSVVRDKSMVLLDNGVEVILENDELQKYGKGFKPSLRASFYCGVKKVDSKHKKVYLKAITYKAGAASEVTEVINKALGEGKRLSTRARVVYIDASKKRVTVDISGVGVKGYITLKEWRESYIPNIWKAAELGSIIDIMIIGKQKDDLGYRCSRRLALADDVWAGIEKRFPLKAQVRIKCSYLGKNEWFGTIDGLSEIEVYCPYPDAEDDISIKLGEEYLCYVYKISEKDHQFRCRVINKVIK